MEDHLNYAKDAKRLLNQEKRRHVVRFKACEIMKTSDTSSKIGRPTKYIPETIHPKIEEYITSCGREATELPTVEGLAIHLQVNPDTLFTWAKDYPAFSESIKRILALQKKQLMNDGMYGGKEVNSTMAIFLLKVNHGMVETPSVQINQQFNVDKGNAITFVNFKNEPTS